MPEETDTYAAVAPNISALLALWMSPTLAANAAVKAAIMLSSAPSFDWACD